MKKKLVVAAAVLLSGSLMFSSCIGSFGLTNKLFSWNKGVGEKWVNEVVFVAFCILPVYEVSLIADALVINSIEFWSGSNPVADVGNVKTIDGKDGVYTVETKVDGYHIQKEGDEKALDLVFNEADQSWNVEADGESTKLLKFNGNDEVVMYLPDGKEMKVELSQSGVLAFQQVANGYSYYAAK